MLQFEWEGNDRLLLRGRLDATQEERAREVLDRIESSCTLDLERLSYISSSGLGLLVALQLRLSRRGASVTLDHVGPYVREMLQLAGLEEMFAVG